jgi:hypothetical protein
MSKHSTSYAVYSWRKLRRKRCTYTPGLDFDVALYRNKNLLTYSERNYYVFVCFEIVMHACWFW